MTLQAMYRWFEFADLAGPEMTATYRAMAERGGGTRARGPFR
ncbi:MAG: hypothetical protein O9284_13000 [Steroidobacteraceae bacterium]|jgi:hypothetical protein|nr:hypothetical protein [Steroidobacteraceae bacterium]